MPSRAPWTGNARSRNAGGEGALAGSGAGQRDAVPLAQLGDHEGSFRLHEGVVPAGRLGERREDPLEHLAREVARESEVRTAQHDIGRVDDLLVRHHVGHLGGRQERARDGLVIQLHLGDVPGDVPRAGAVALEEHPAPLRREPGQLAADPGIGLRRRGEVPSTPDGQAVGGHDPLTADEGERAIGEVFAERAEGRPLAADEVEHGCPRTLGVDDAVVPRDEAGGEVVVARQGADAGEAKDDLRPVHRDVGEDLRDEVEEVVDLLLGAHGWLGRVRVDVGRADEHAVLQRIHQDDAAVVVLEEDLPPAGGGQQLRVVEHDVGALRAAGQCALAAECGVREVEPGSRGVHDGARGDQIGRAHV